MKTLFDSTQIAGLSLKNRFVRSATWEGLADEEGAVTPQQIEKMVELAEGEVGLIIIGFAFVSANGKSVPHQLAAHEDRFVPGLRQMADAVHAAGGKIALQLGHGGYFADSVLTRLELVSPSVRGQARAMYSSEIIQIAEDFAQAALRAKKAGFDAIELHAGHGFLISQFLSPAFNHRTDEFGGSLENRARFLLEIISRIRASVGGDYPVLVKLNSEDFLENGMTREESAELAGLLEKASVNAIELSGGTMTSDAMLIPPRPGALKKTENEVYYRAAAALHKQRLSIPVLLVGGIRSYEVAEELIESGTADYISLARPLVVEPDLVKRWHAGDKARALCISCNQCLGFASNGSGIRCGSFARKSTTGGVA
ncbi:TPA: NADH:flavin oxidoreductase [Candidatus Sumerlaeota bacterium]|jgi:2,4-dienoyl-CoA reductase-like NADH-dependent reductase (Old Yellow Enzyme family)|nr:NADH:flavin oxidoreductase [Candidatus Sumerlaeota bacterium]